MEITSTIVVWRRFNADVSGTSLSCIYSDDGLALTTPAFESFYVQTFLVKTVETGYKNCNVSQRHALFCEERQEYTVSLLSSHFCMSF